MINVFGCNTGPEEIDELADSVRGGWMGMGRKVVEFEEAFSRKIGAGFVMVDSGSNALSLAVRLLDLPAGSGVIVPSFTWVACAHAVVLAGLQPVFADVNLRTQNLDASAVERAMLPHVRAIMAVHYAGKPARLHEIARAFRLPLIEDAAHAVDSALAGRHCGTIGAVGIFSFDSVKNLATPEGGGLTCADAELLDRARRLRYCGIGKSGFEASAATATAAAAAAAVPGRSFTRWWEYDVREVYHKALPNDVAASIGLAQLRKLEVHQAWRRRIWEFYQAHLSRVGWLGTPSEPEPDERHSYFTYFVRVLDGRRDALACRLREQGIYTTLRYHPLHLNPVYGWPAERRLPNCEKLNEQGLNLPLHPRLTDADVERIVECVRTF